MTTSPPDPLLTLDEALARLLAAVQPLGATERVSTFDALGRFDETGWWFFLELLAQQVLIIVQVAFGFVEVVLFKGFNTTCLIQLEVFL